MPSGLINDVTVRGIACAVPKRKLTSQDLAATFGEKAARRLVKATGVAERRIDSAYCTSDYCAAAAERLLTELSISRDSVDHIVVVTQSADYKLPATACVLQDRLQLPTSCSAFDVNQGCAGYPYGLWIASRLLDPGQRALLLVGDTSSSYISDSDRSLVPLFGDAGSATLVEHSPGAPPIAYSIGTDGSGFDNIIVEAGHCRVPHSGDTASAETDDQGNTRSPENLRMNGPEVFSFALKNVPQLISEVTSQLGWDSSSCGDLVFHQANQFMLTTLADKLGVPPERVPLSLPGFGNTSSASIPLTLVTQSSDKLTAGGHRFTLAGFGVGWSWAGAAFQPKAMAVPSLIEL